MSIEHLLEEFGTASESRRGEIWAQVKIALADVVQASRLHRVEACLFHPLCPGNDALELLESGHVGSAADALQIMLAALTDASGEIDNLSKRVEQAEARALRAEDERRKAVQEAEAGWSAFQNARRDHRKTLRAMGKVID